MFKIWIEALNHSGCWLPAWEFLLERAQQSVLRFLLAAPLISSSRVATSAQLILPSTEWINRFDAEPLILVGFQFVASSAMVVSLCTILSNIQPGEEELLRFVSTKQEKIKHFVAAVVKLAWDLDLQQVCQVWGWLNGTFWVLARKLPGGINLVSLITTKWPSVRRKRTKLLKAIIWIFFKSFFNGLNPQL